MPTTICNKKKYCITCDEQLIVTSVPTQVLDNWLCPKHGEQGEAIIYLHK